jgi:hypothetical protein
MDLDGCAVGQALMRTLVVVEPEAAAKSSFQSRHSQVILQVDILILD